MSTPALARTRLTIGALMAVGTLSTGAIAAGLAVAPSNAEAADEAPSAESPALTPWASPTPSVAKKQHDNDDDADDKPVTKTSKTTTTTKKPVVKKTTATQPKVKPAPAPKPAPSATKTKTKGS